MSESKITSKDVLYGPSFMFKIIKELKEYVNREIKLESVLSEYCDQDVVLCTHTVLAIKTLTMILLPFTRDYQLAEKEADRFILDCEWGSYRDSEGKPYCIDTPSERYIISSTVNWIRYINDTYMKSNKFRQLLFEDNIIDQNK